MIEIVRHSDGRVGVRIPNTMGLPPRRSDRVDFDGTGIEVCFRELLEIVEVVEVKFDPEKCPKCIFAGKSTCLRYGHNGYLGTPPPLNGEKIPKRIPPFCQQEMEN